MSLIPLTFPKEMDDKAESLPLMLSSYHERLQWTSKGMWAFVCKEWTTPLAEWIGNRKCLEVMAGAGWLAHALHQDGVDIIATDDMSWVEENNWMLVHDVEKLDAVQSILKYGEDIDILIMSWPYMDTVCYNVVRKLRMCNPNALIVYIGETEGGCTACAQFFLSTEWILDEDFIKVSSKYKSWPTIHDSIQLRKIR